MAGEPRWGNACEYVKNYKQACLAVLDKIPEAQIARLIEVLASSQGRG